MRATSLASRFLVTLLVTCVLPLVVFGWFTLRGVRELIDAQVVSTYLPRLAADQAHKIDERLQLIYQACSIVRELVREPLDSRVLTAFEEQVELVPDLLDNFLDLLLVVDGQGRVVHRQEGHRLDPNRRAQRAACIPASVRTADWFQRLQRDGRTLFLPWGRSDYLQSTGSKRSTDPAAYHLGLAMEVPQDGEHPGALLALIRWAEVQWVLDETREVLVRESRFPSAQVFLTGADGVVYAHTDRSRYGQPIEPRELREAVLAADVRRARFVADDGRTYHCGLQRLLRAPGWSWILGLSIPEDELFAATYAFTRVLAAAIAVTLVVLIVWSLVASRAIVRPVHDLVVATGRVARGDLAVRVPAGGGPELGELAASFNQMAAELAAGRERLALAEREKAWAEMARQVAHEIKNPLTPMRMAAQLLLRARADGDPRADAVADRLARTVQEQTEVLDRIASDFQQFAGAPTHELHEVELDAFLGDMRAAAGDLFEAGRLRLQLLLAAPGVRVRIDRRELQRVFVNLLQNATQAAPGGVLVRIESVATGTHGTVRVVDDGPGIPEPVRPRLFEPYFTTKTAGTGLGLAICRRIVEAHGGSIQLESTGAAGTVFRIDLPRIGADLPP